MKEQWETPPTRAFLINHNFVDTNPPSPSVLLFGITSIFCGLDRVLKLLAIWLKEISWVGVGIHHII